ncbi:hypothetical protein Py17XNL_001002373 [Plasmodium yoelii yoelii]|uniref:Uncharacterized protein n=1 Tax=Plasmodium yoelii yoelii TaxID=73239 RepID=A0AAE9WQL1_PLAYO|nr:hypothetical protein Py17XNL_001002373 [Plasmodium yoelii yoelii]
MLDLPVKREHMKITNFLIKVIVVINALSFLLNIILSIKLYNCSYNITAFLLIWAQTCLWAYIAILNLYDKKYFFSASSLLGFNLYTQCYSSYGKLFLPEDIQEYQFMSIALSHFPILYICYDIVIFQYDSIFMKSNTRKFSLKYLPEFY